MTSADRQQIEARLEARLEELVRTRAAMRLESEGMLDSEPDIDNHPADIGTEMHDLELDATTRLFMEEEERRITEARRALANGTYGTCVSCGRPIPAERLAAEPEAVRCLDCQRHFEAAHRQRTIV
jgi:RNA polymerase-binding transcription factor DksA